MQYLNKSFTLPTTTKRISQTDYEIAVGLRHPDGTLVQPNRPAEVDLNDEHDFWDWQ